MLCKVNTDLIAEPLRTFLPEEEPLKPSTAGFHIGDPDPDRINEDTGLYTEQAQSDDQTWNQIWALCFSGLRQLKAGRPTPISFTIASASERSKA